MAQEKPGGKSAVTHSARPRSCYYNMMISIQGVSKIYGQGKNSFAAVDNVSINIPKGIKLAIIGKSGSGKSTFMHVVSGLDSVTSGHILVNGDDITALKAKEIDAFRSKDMGFIFQSFFVEPNQTCFQNIMVPLEIARTPRAKRRGLVLEALDAVGLADKASNNAANLSGGQKQRLAVARAIVNKPKIIFADEPTGNLDSVTGNMVIKLLFKLNEKLGITLLVVTHDHDLAKQCDSQVHLKDGKISKVVDPKKLLKERV